ncbi:MAG: nucleotide exchange factor GrpE [Bacteroidales bacterium]
MKDENSKNEELNAEELSSEQEDNNISDQTIDSQDDKENAEKEEPQKEKDAPGGEDTKEDESKIWYDKWVRLQAEFDNYRRRTSKERMDLIKTAGEGIFKDMIPVIDDLNRGLELAKQSDDINSVIEGMELIHNKFTSFLNKNSVKEIEAMHQDFDTDLHDAVTKIPAPSEELKGKVVDVIQKGYTLGDKVIRFPKVVIGE